MMTDQLNIDENRNKPIIIASIVAGVLLLVIVVALFAFAGGDDKKSSIASSKNKKSKTSSSTTSTTEAKTTTSYETLTSITTTTISKSVTTSPTIHIMPFVVCETTASAQSKIKATGVNNMSFQDADGEREPEIGNSWVVTRQYPDAGEEFEDHGAVLDAVPQDELSEGECE